MTPPLRVLMTADAVGGVWTYALDLAKGLSPRAQTSLAVLGPPPTPSQRLAAQAIDGLALIETGLPLDWMAGEPAEIRAAAEAVRGLARRLDADVVHLNSPALAGAGGFSAPVVGACHSCLATWWSAVKDGPMPADFRWRTRALWRGMLACDALLAPSESFAEATSRTYETPLPFVVRNGRARPDAPAPGERQALVFTSGRLWDEGKNVAVLDAAARLIEAPLLAAGPLEAPGGGNRIALAAARPLGRLDAEAVAAWLRRARIYASSARYEPFGLGVLEAAQAGCALVLSDIPTFRELWDGAALFAPADDPAAFAAACGTLLADEAQALRLGRRARARARRFSVEAMSAGVLEVYRHVLSQRTGAMAARAVA